MSTSKLQELTAKRLHQTLSSLTIKENYRPEWMDNGESRLELDFYVPDYKLAIEVQGEQHYHYIEFFHGDYEGFLSQQKRDEDKRTICRFAGIRLVEISSEEELNDFIIELKEKYQQYSDFLSNRKAFFEHETIIQVKAINDKIKSQARVVAQKKLDRDNKIEYYNKKRNEAIEAAIKKIDKKISGQLNHFVTEVDVAEEKLNRLLENKEDATRKALENIPQIWAKYCKKNNITS